MTDDPVRRTADRPAGSEVSGFTCAEKRRDQVGGARLPKVHDLARFRLQDRQSPAPEKGSVGQELEALDATPAIGHERFQAGINRDDGARQAILDDFRNLRAHGGGELVEYIGLIAHPSSAEVNDLDTRSYEAGPWTACRQRP